MRRLHALASNSSRASLGEWLQTALLGANLVWTTLCLGGYRPETMVVTTALTGVALAVCWIAGAVTGGASLFGRVSIAFLPFLLYGAWNVLVISPVPWLGWLDWLGWANMLAVFQVARNGIRSMAPRRTLFFLVILLGVVAVAMGCYQRFVHPGWLMLGRTQVEQFLERASGPFGIPNSLAAFLLLWLPAAGALAFRRHATAVERVWWGWIALVFALGILLTVSRGAWLALAVTLIAWPLIGTDWSWQRKIGSAAVVLVVIVGLGAALFQAAPKVRERFTQLVRQSGELSRPILWRGAWNLFLEQPVTGTGAGSFNVLFERHRPARFVDDPQWAHNDYLNTLSDYGAIGFLLAFGPAVGLFVRGRKRGVAARTREHWLDSRTTRVALGMGILAFALQLFVDFHFKIPALAMALATTAALALGPPRERESVRAGTGTSTRWLRLGGMVAAVVVIACLIPVGRIYRAEAARYSARQAIDRYNLQRKGDLAKVLTESEAKLRRATQLDSRNATAWSDLAFALEMKLFVAPRELLQLAAAEEEAARRALAISVVVAEFWTRLGVALDLQGRFEEAEEAYQRSVQLAPRHSHAWYYYAAHLSRDTKQREAAIRAIATCLSLDPGNATAEALREKLHGRP